jgi:hypothetical protein
MRNLSQRPGWSPPVSFLPRWILEPRRPVLAIAAGWLTAFIPSLLLAALVAQWLPSLEQPNLAMDSQLAIILVTLVAPVIETLIMAGVIAVLLRLMPPTAAVLASAIGWGIAHSLAAPAWGLVIWWPFLVFSTLYVVWSRRSLLAGLAVPATVHALQNLLPALLMFSGTEV